ncbi:MAG: N-acetyltransferase [Deltaproteobacteria bacterium]|nr:N-acetyltransferase [Deltaproteobacteria bacterium]
MNIQVRTAQESDRAAIVQVVCAAFGEDQGDEIVDLTADLLADPGAQPSLSLLATVDGGAVGHILFTNARIQTSQRYIRAAILAPLSVHPAFHNQGIGGQLINAGLQQLQTAGVALVFVLGHPGYYPKYGFSPAGIQGFDAPYTIPPEHAGAWMVQELQQGIIGRFQGQVICADALNDPKHWRE